MLEGKVRKDGETIKQKDETNSSKKLCEKKKNEEILWSE